MPGLADTLASYLPSGGANFGTSMPQEDPSNQDPTPTLEGILRGANETAKNAFDASNKFSRTGEYNPGPVLDAALMGVGPTFGMAPVDALGAAGGKMALRAADAAPAVADPALKAEAEALRGKWAKYADEYPETGPPNLIDKDTGEPVNYRSETAAQKRVDAGTHYWSKQLTPEAQEFAADRAVIQRDMDVNGYTPHFDPAQRAHVDPSNYPPAPDMTVEQGGRANPMKPETRAKYEDLYNTPAARDRMVTAYNEGKLIPGSNDWYAVKQLEDSYIQHLGPVEGRKAFKTDFAGSMSATTGGSDPTSNYLMSHYANFENAAGRSMPPTYELPYPIGGRYAGTNLRMYDKWADAGKPSWGVENPKRSDFSSAFTGNPNAFTTDEQISGIIKPAVGKTPAMVEPQWYGPAAQTGHEAAADVGVVPRDFQDVAWAGEKKRKFDLEQAAKPPEKRQAFQYEGPMISHVNESIERTSRLTGRTPAQVERLRVLKKIPMYGIGGIAAVDQLKEAHDRGLISDEQYEGLNNGQR